VKKYTEYRNYLGKADYSQEYDSAKTCVLDNNLFVTGVFLKQSKGLFHRVALRT
jgi:hypothetical protein